MLECREAWDAATERILTIRANEIAGQWDAYKAVAAAAKDVVAAVDPERWEEEGLDGLAFALAGLDEAGLPPQGAFGDDDPRGRDAT